jgi:pyruvate kinase
LERVNRTLRTKIVATVGPATASRDRIAEVLRAGANVIRVNFAHGDELAHREVVGWVRDVAAAMNLPVAILADLAGPKIRIGVLSGPIELTPGDVVTIAPEDELGPGDDALPSTYPELAGDVGPGSRILLDDGGIELRVTATAGSRVTAEVIRGGTLRANKGLNLPGVRVSAPALTAKDRRDLELAAELDVDYVGLSFVQSPEDVETLRALLPAGLLIVAKIEKDVALERLQDILDSADAVMVARGDLGSSSPSSRCRWPRNGSSSGPTCTPARSSRLRRCWSP